MSVMTECANVEASDTLITYDKLFIGGNWVTPLDGGMMDSVDPSIGRVWARVAYGGAADVDRAVAAAREALEGPWGKMAGWQRAEVLRRFADLYGAAAPKLAEIETRDNGRAVRETRADIGGHAKFYHWFASLADKTHGRTIPMEDSVPAFTPREPIGVVGAICPWNVPLMSACWKLGPALAAGCTVVDPESVITTHLTEIIKQHMPELLTYGAVQELIEGLPRPYQKLAGEISGTSPTILVQHVLQALLLERISIRNLPLIVEAIAEAGRTTSSVTLITEHVRRRLSNQICHALTDPSGFVPVITMSSSWETEFNGAVRMNGEERNFLMSPQRVQEFVLEARKEIQRFAQQDEWPALMVSPEVRSFVRSMLERVSPMTQVISHNEVHRKAALRTVATIGG
mgnify:CR=1 FL=1